MYMVPGSNAKYQIWTGEGWEKKNGIEERINSMNTELTLTNCVSLSTCVCVCIHVRIPLNSRHLFNPTIQENEDTTTNLWS